jgi:hypothetical protein
MKLVVACLVAALAVAVAGCGGSESPQFTREIVETTMTDAIDDQMRQQGATIDRLTCVMDGDQYHWRCLSEARQGQQAYTLTVSIVCDGDTGQCISEPATLAPKP